MSFNSKAVKNNIYTSLKLTEIKLVFEKQKVGAGDNL